MVEQAVSNDYCITPYLELGFQALQSAPLLSYDLSKIPSDRSIVFIIQFACL